MKQRIENREWKWRIVTAMRWVSISILLFVSSAHALNINGYYETEFYTKRIGNENNRWELQTPRHHLQMKFYAAPYKGVDLYTQFNVDSNDMRSQQKRFFLDRAWGKFWHPKAEIMALKREERHYIDSPLLRLVNQDVVSYNRDSQAVRLEVFDFYKLRGRFLFTVEDENKKSLSPQVGEWYGSYYDQKAQSFVANFYRRMYEKKSDRIYVDLGGNFLRKDWQFGKFGSQTDPITGTRSLILPGEDIAAKNEVYSGELRLGWRGASWNTEVAMSSSVRMGSLSPDGDARAYQTEIRDLRLGNFLMRGAYFNYGKNFRSELSSKFSGRRVRTGGSNEFGRDGYSTELVYFEDAKLVQFTFRRTEYKTQVESSENNPALREDYIVYYSTAGQRVVDQFGEMFVQFVGGLEARMRANNYRSRSGDFWGATIELRGENPVGFGRVQFRVRDIGSDSGLGERYIIGGEFRVNLTDHAQVLTRLVNAQSNFLKRNWWSGFWQLRYFIGTDMEIYFEYGDGGPTGNLAEGGIGDDSTIRPVDQVKLFFRVNF